MPIETIAAGNNVNNPGGHTKKFRSTFPLGAPIAGTYRYGEYGVIFGENVIANDGPFKWIVPHDIRSFILKAPLMQNMNIKKDAFFVPKQAILPLNWEKIETLPIKGEDVPEDANTVIRGFENKIRTQIYNWRNYLKTFNLTTSLKEQQLIESLLKMAIMAEKFYSAGCLLSAMGHPMESYWINREEEGDNRHCFAQWFDKIVELVKKAYNQGTPSLRTNGEFYVISDNPDEGGITWREALQYLREETTIPFTDENSDFSPAAANPDDFAEIIDYIDNNCYFDILETNANKPFNYERLIAYQIVCAHFYSNDKIDYIYTADLWRQLMWEYANGTDTGNKTFQQNDLTYKYDTLSGAVFNDVIFNYDYWHLIDENQLGYINAIFTYKRSLRFQDYFTGARSQPLAVMDYNVAVNNNLVSVIDITRHTLMQKLGNALNKVGNRIESQVKELFGIEMKPDYHNPFWLWHTSDAINTPETENTADAMFNLPDNASKLPVTSQFRSNAGSKMFEFSCDRKGIVVCICYFDIPRLYTRATERFFYHADRFDEYNPYMQFTGDQTIKKSELIAHASSEEIFGYTGPNMEYKQKYGRAWGGWVHDLPGWSFIADKNRTDYEMDHIKPDYIRAISTEIDDLFQNLNGYCIDRYYHFIIKSSIMCEATRPMAYNPGILQ